MALMASSPEQALTDRQRAALETLLRDLRTIFGARLHALVAYGLVSTNVDGSYVRTLGLVERVTFDDLARAVPLAAEWLRRGLAVPLLLSRHEFERTLDVFPLEYRKSHRQSRRHRRRRSVCDGARRRCRPASRL